jgi:hypothetical protein
MRELVVDDAVAEDQHQDGQYHRQPEVDEHQRDDRRSALSIGCLAGLGGIVTGGAAGSSDWLGCTGPIQS